MRKGVFGQSTLSAAIFFSCVLGTGAVHAKTLYVSSSGSDSNSGTSSSSPLKSAALVVAKAAAGDTILLKRGDVFYVDRPLRITKDNVKVSAYGEGSRPVIHGNNFKQPGGIYEGLVVMGNTTGSSGHGALVEHLELKQSSGQGVKIFADNAHVRNVYVNESLSSGITVHASASGAVVEDSEVYHHNYAWGPKNLYEALGVSGTTWGQGIVSKGVKFVFKNNYVHHGWGEGMGAGCGGSDGVIEGNTLLGNKIGVYLDHAQNVKVSNNRIEGTANESYWRGSSTIGQGISVNHETWCSKQAQAVGLATGNNNLRIENNTVRFTSTGFTMWTQQPDYKMKNVTVACNIFEDNQYQFEGVESPVEGFKVYNNIFSKKTIDGAQMVKHFSLSGSMDFWKNFWSFEPKVDKAVVSSSDIIGGSVTQAAECAQLAGVSSKAIPMPPTGIVVE